jgi:hypothetical protein
VTDDQSAGIELRLEAILEAVRALKPAPVEMPTWLDHLRPIGPGTVAPPVSPERFNTHMDRAEIKRLNAVVADQALTIATLKDELGRLTSHAHRQELQRFLDREAKVFNLVCAAIEVSKGRTLIEADAAQLSYLAVAVRDFRVTT